MVVSLYLEELAVKNTVPLVTIIIPVFNTGKLLSRTLESVRGQTFESWECILVDDGSTDESRDIAQEFIERDRRFVMMRQNHQGPNVARNLAMCSSRGQYIYLCDHDDWMHPKLLEYCVWALERYNSDFVSFQSIGQKTEEIADFCQYTDFEAIPVIQPQNIFSRLSAKNEFCISITAWSYFLRRELALSAPFTGMSGIPRLMKVLLNAQNPIVSSARLYHYSVFNVSWMRSAVKLSFIREFHQSLVEVCDVFQNGAMYSSAWRIVQRAIILKNLKYQLNSIRRSGGSLSDSELGELKVALAEELRDIRSRGCLPYWQCNPRHALAYWRLQNKYGRSKG